MGQTQDFPGVRGSCLVLFLDLIYLLFSFVWLVLGNKTTWLGLGRKCFLAERFLAGITGVAQVTSLTKVTRY